MEDRHENWNVLGPTHEESFTELMSGILQSYRDLPVNVYQIHTKFRDEIRPRYGVMRSREFVMKDAYSFSLGERELDRIYQKMRMTYRRIFTRLGLKTLPVEADTGSMGGSDSEEFMVPSEVGEEILLISERELYRGNQEKTPVLYPELEKGEGPSLPVPSRPEKVHTPGATTIEEVARFLKMEIPSVMKSLVYRADGKLLVVFLRGDRQVNEVKLKNHLGVGELEPATGAEIASLPSVQGYVGPVGLPDEVKQLYDSSLLTRDLWVVGANEAEYHYTNFAFSEVPDTVDLALAVEGDPSPAKDGVLHEIRGIEVGHIFKLGDKYARAFQLTVLDENGKPVTPLMGCYGIGVNRTLAAIIEQGSHEKGFQWPVTCAPFEAVLISLTKKEEERRLAETLYLALESSGVEVLWDDRDLRAGVKFADADLIGFPIRITAGKSFFETGKLELQVKQKGVDEILEGNLQEMVARIAAWRDTLLKEREAELEELENLE